MFAFTAYFKALLIFYITNYSIFCLLTRFCTLFLLILSIYQTLTYLTIELLLKIMFYLPKGYATCNYSQLKLKFFFSSIWGRKGSLLKKIPDNFMRYSCVIVQSYIYICGFGAAKIALLYCRCFFQRIISRDQTFFSRFVF